MVGATHESVTVIPEHAIGGQQLVRILDCLKIERRLPQVIRSNYWKEFTGKAMLNWAHERGVERRLI